MVQVEPKILGKKSAKKAFFGQNGGKWVAFATLSLKYPENFQSKTRHLKAVIKNIGCFFLVGIFCTLPLEPMPTWAGILGQGPGKEAGGGQRNESTMEMPSELFF